MASGKFIKFFAPEIDSVDSPILKQRVPFIVGANLVFVTFFTLFFASVILIRGEFGLFVAAIIVSIALQITAFVLIRTGKYKAGAASISASLFISALAILYLFPIASAEELYRGLAFILVMSVCNLLIAPDKKQLSIFCAGTLAAWVLSFFTIYAGLLETAGVLTYGILAVGVLALLLSSAMFLLSNHLTTSLFIAAEQETKKATKAFGTLTSVMQEAQKSLNIGKQINSSAAQVIKSAVEIEELHADIARDGEELNDKSTHIQVSGETVMGKVSQMKRNIQDQNAAITETSAAITQISANITSISDIAGKRRDSMNAILQNLDSQKQLVQKLREEVENVRKSSEGIAGFVKTVEDISSQTGLLAMNASIEAAHAGVSGKGFAVIALEIRKLSEETRKNSSYISDVLRKNEETVNATTDSVQEFTAYIEKSADDSTKTINAIEEILSGVSEMDIGTREVMNAVKNIVEKTHETSQTVDVVVGEIGKQRDELSVISEFSEKLSTRIESMKGNLSTIMNSANTLAEEGKKNTELVERVSVSLKDI